VFVPAHYLSCRKSPYDQLKLPPVDNDLPSAAVNRFAPVSIFIVAIADAGAAYTGTLAYQYDVSIASVAFLNSFAIPCAMVLSYFILGATFSKRHGLGILLALLGLIVVVYGDVEKAKNGQAQGDSLLGDALTLLSAFLYATSNVLSEKLIKSGSYIFFLAWLGMSGALLTGIQTGIVEPRAVLTAPWSTDAAVPLLFVTFSASFALIYGLVAKFLVVHDSVALNLNFLTTNIWGVVFGMLLFDEVFIWQTGVGFLCIIAGLFVYHTATMPSKVSDPSIVAIVEGDQLEERFDGLDFET